MSKNGKNANWKVKLKQAETLMGKTFETFYDRVSILNDVFEDLNFRAEMELVDDDKAMRYLDGFLSDTWLRFHQARALLSEFPEKADWLEFGTLARLRDELLDRQRQRAKTEVRPKPARRAVKVKDFERACAERDEAKKEATFFQRESGKKEMEIDRLRRENAELRAENERLTREVERLKNTRGRSKTGTPEMVGV